MSKSHFLNRYLNSHHWYTPEHRLVFQCALTNHPQPHIKLGERWQQLATLHDTLYGVSGALPFISHRLQESGVDSKLKNSLHGVSRHTWTNNQLAISKMKTLSAELHQHQVRHAFAGDMAIVYYLYQPNHIRPIGSVRLIVDDKDLSSAIQLIKSHQSDDQFKLRKPSYLFAGREFIGGHNPTLSITNGVIQQGDLSQWQLTEVDDLPLVDRSALLFWSVARDIGLIPSIQHMIDILYILNQLTDEEQERIIQQFEKMGLCYLFWQSVIYLVDKLGMTQFQSLADRLAINIKSQFVSYMQHRLYRFWQRIR
jgi:hypothetical protein